MLNQDWQPIQAGQGCKCERAACASETPLEMHTRDSQTPGFLCRQTAEVWSNSGVHDEINA